jgi:hypothetical protein
MHKVLRFLMLSIVLNVISVGISTPAFDALGQNNAADLYKNKPLVFPPHIKHLVILIPNEAHESLNQPKDSWPLINQTYLPQNAVVYQDTMVTWFNGDRDHDHRVSLTNNRNPDSILFDSGTIEFNEASGAIQLNDIATYDYYEENVCQNLQDPKSCNFVMRGNVTVISKANLEGTTTTLPGNINANSTNDSMATKAPDIAGVIMIPAQDSGNYVQDLESKGIVVDSTYNFSSVRPGGQEGTGDTQTLIVWTTSGSVDEVISHLQEIMQELPYI